MFKTSSRYDRLNTREMNEIIVHAGEDLEVGDILFLIDKTTYTMPKVIGERGGG